MFSNKGVTMVDRDDDLMGGRGRDLPRWRDDERDDERFDDEDDGLGRGPVSRPGMSTGKLALIGGGILGVAFLGLALATGGAAFGLLLNIGILGGLGAAGVGTVVAYNKMREAALNPKSEDEKPVKEQKRGAIFSGISMGLKAALGVTAAFFVSTIGIPLLTTAATFGLVAAGAMSFLKNRSQAKAYEEMSPEERRQNPDIATPKKFKARMIGMGVGAIGATMLNLAAPAIHTPLSTRSIHQEYNEKGGLKWTPMTSAAPENSTQLASAGGGTARARAPGAGSVLGGA